MLDWVATGLSIGGFMGVLCVFDVLQRIALPFGLGAHQWVVTRMARGCNWGARLGSLRFRADGLENVKPGQNYIIVSNHQSLLDISMASEYLGALRPRYVSKWEIARGVPGVSYNLRHGGSALIDRKNPTQAIAEIEKLAAHIREDHWSALIFPEGTRSKTGAMRPFRTSGLRALVAGAPGVPILPVTTGGGSRAFRNNLRPIVRNVELTFRVHPPMLPPDPKDDAKFEAFVRSLERVMQSGLPPEDQATQAKAEAATDAGRTGATTSLA
jgi:1-acyl-sn-glycerol-3-phosphate acyltransferase